jgi:hypothetical protein
METIHLEALQLQGLLQSKNPSNKMSNRNLNTKDSENQKAFHVSMIRTAWCCSISPLGAQEIMVFCNPHSKCMQHAIVIGLLSYYFCFFLKKKKTSQQ